MVIVALFCAVILAATIDAAQQLPNGGRILSPGGEYIDGKCLHRIRIFLFYL